MSTLVQDLKYSLRLLLKSPGFSLTAVLVLALGIGANAAVFSLVNGMLLKPVMGSEKPGQLVGVYSHDKTKADVYRGFSYPAYADIRDRAKVFSEVTAFNLAFAGLGEGEATKRVFVAVVTGNYFSTFGVSLLAGRTFNAEEERPDSQAAVAIVSYQVLEEPWIGAGDDRPDHPSQLEAVHDCRHRPGGFHGQLGPRRAGCLGSDRRQRPRSQRLHARYRPRLPERPSQQRPDGPGPPEAGCDGGGSGRAARRAVGAARARIPGGEQEPAPVGAHPAPRVDLDEPQGRRGPGGALRRADGDGSDRPADRVPQPREHDARPRDSATEGNRDAAGARRRALAHRPPAGDRRLRALGHRRHGGAARRLLGDIRARLLASAVLPGADHARHRARPPRGPGDDRVLRAGDDLLQPRSRMEALAHQRGAGVEGAGGGGLEEGPLVRGPEPAGRRADRAVAGPADHGGPLHPRRRQGRPGRSGLPLRSPAPRVARHGAGRIRRGAGPAGVQPTDGARAPGSRCAVGQPGVHGRVRQLHRRSDGSAGRHVSRGGEGRPGGQERGPLQRGRRLLPDARRPPAERTRVHRGGGAGRERAPRRDHRRAARPRAVPRREPGRPADPAGPAGRCRAGERQWHRHQRAGRIA